MKSYDTQSSISVIIGQQVVSPGNVSGLKDGGWHYGCTYNLISYSIIEYNT